MVAAKLTAWVAVAVLFTGPAGSTPSATPAPVICYSDADLEISGNALLYVWSPRMVLSATEASLAAKAAQVQGLAFIPLVDGRIAPQEWQAAIKRLSTLRSDRPSKPQPGGVLDLQESAQVLLDTRPLCSSQLLERDAYRHFPTAFLKTGVGIHPFALVGAMPEAFWNQGLRLRLQGSQP